MSSIRLDDSIQNALNRTVEYIPRVLGGLLILLIGHIVARVLQTIVRQVLLRVQFERALDVSPAGKYIARFITSPSGFVARLVYWIVFILFISAAVSMFNIPALNTIVAGFYAYIPKILASALIFLVASAITMGSAKFVRRILGDGAMAGLIGAVLPAIIMSIAVFMILNELQIAKDIVNITFAAIMGSLALGLALAFGLGGRDVAARILSQAYDKAQKRQVGSNLRRETTRPARRR